MEVARRSQHGSSYLRSRLTIPGLLAYGVATAFILAGILVLAGGDAHVDPNRTIRHPIDVAGDERHLFGSLLLAAGYVLWRWVFRRPGAPHRLSVELQIIALFALLGYAAYRVGG